MNIVVIFHNIGGYHAARLRAAATACQQRGWKLTAIQETDNAHEHPWGDLKQAISFPLETLVPTQYFPDAAARNPYSYLADSQLPACLVKLAPSVLVIPGWGYPISRAALKWAGKARIPTILMSESKWDDEPRRWWKEKLKSLLYVRHFDAALVGGQHHKDYLVKLGFSPERVFQGYDAVDNDYFSARAELARSNPAGVYLRQPLLPKKPYFLATTRLILRKNIDRLVDAYCLYRNQVADNPWDLVICGSGIEEGNLKQKVHGLGLQNSIHFPGFVSYNAITDWYGLANAFIHPALQEQWGLVINEACASRLPILCSKTVGAQISLVENGKNGLLFDPFNINDMLRILLATYHLDETQRLQWGQKSLELVSEYGPERFAQGLIECLNIIQKSKAQSQVA